jgi:hypothetical protein
MLYKPSVPLVGQKICFLHEILTWLVIIDTAENTVFSNKQPCQWKEGVVWPTKSTGALQHHNHP